MAGYISETMHAGRIVSHGKVTDLSAGFKLPGNNPFSVYIRPKAGSSAADALDVLLKVRCYQDDDFSDAPVVLNDWSPLEVAEIAPGQDILNDCDIYWGCGSYIKLP